MITETLIRKIENKTEIWRKNTLSRLCRGVTSPHVFELITFFNIGSNGIEDIYGEMMRDQLRIEEVKKNMKAKKGMTKNQKLKMLKTSKAKKMVKSTKK